MSSSSKMPCTSSRPGHHKPGFSFCLLPGNTARPSREPWPHDGIDLHGGRFPVRFMAYRFPLCYNMGVARPYTELVRGCFIMLKNILNFLKAVMASVVSYYLCKWLDCLFQIMSN